MKENLVCRSLIAFHLLTIASTLTLFNVDSTLAKTPNCANTNSNIEYKECQHRAYATADQKLNQVYKQIVSKLSGVEKQKLINAQLAWIKFRDNNCDFEVYESRRGSGYSGFLSECLERMTYSRIKELEDWHRLNSAT
jgi:uncharacterized protein YecT (DUF1311 family)